MGSFKLEIITPTDINELENVSYVRCPGSDGSFGILNGHREGIIALGVGEIKVTQNGKDSYYATSGGFTEITTEKVQFLLETVESSKDIDLNRAKASLKRSKDRISNPGVDFDRAESALFKAVNRLRIINR
jgi:F-type H+-transporting ATPase subunit epsilon